MKAPEKLTTRIKLPSTGGKLEEFRLSAPRDFGGTGRKAFNRIALAAAQVVADPLALGNPWLDAAVDWDATIVYRRYLWSLGLGVAEAMDTAQRGMGLDWNNSLGLIRRSIEASKDIEGAVLFSGAGTDQLAPSAGVTLDEVVAAYDEQCEAIERLGGRIVLMASRALAACARSPDDYQKVYSLVLARVKRPVIIHWLGEMFDPQLAGYWGEKDTGRAMNVALAVTAANPAKIDGIKISLLGIFDAIAPAASAALARLASGDAPGFREILAPTVPLARHIFKAPTRFYKTGLAFLAWLNGRQGHFVMVGGQQSARSVVDLAETFRLADAAGLLRDPELAASRMRQFLAVNGIGG